VHGLRASDLRRELRGAELESFAARRRNVGREASASGLAPLRIAMAGRAVAASVLLAAAFWMAPALDRQSATWMHAAAPRAAANSVGRELPPVAVQRPLVTVAPAPSELSTAGETVDNPSASGSAAQHQNVRGVDTSVSAAPLISSSVIGRDIFSPSFADDGQEVLFHAGRNGAALMRASFDGSGHAAVATLLQDGAANHHGTVSPDGARLAYDSDRDGTRAVYVARADASHPEKISGTGYAAVPRWSPDGRRLAFIRAELNRPRVWNVWVADLEAHTLSRVSHHKVGQAWGGSWFPDGHRIAYSVEDTLVIADLKGGTSRVLHAPRRGQLIRTPAVSPDGKWIVFQVHGDGVWLLNVATMAMRRVLGDAAAEEFAWSPDSTRVAYHTMRQHAWSLWQLELRPAAAG
jgi:Tol biopolymer transport system component